MKAKLIPALLLSFVMVSGAVTINDAYAQTNTERLATVDETTMDNNDLLMAISSAIDTMTNSVMEMLMSISDAISGVDDNVSAVNDNVSAVNDNVNDLTGHVSNVTASVDGLGADVSAVANDVSAVDSKLDGLMTALATFGSQVVSTSDIENLHEEIEGQADTLSDISESLVSPSDISDAVSDANAENAATLDRIVRGITNNAAKLNQLETMLNNIQMDADMDREAAEEAVMAAVPDPITMLYSGEITHTVYQRNFGDAASGKIPPKDDKGLSTYKAAFELVCDEDVFLNTVTTNIESNNIDHVFPYHDEGDPDRVDGTEATLYVGGIPIYKSNIAEIKADQVSLNRKDHSLGRMALAAGDALDITTTHTAKHDFVTALNGYVSTPFGEDFTYIAPRYNNNDGPGDTEIHTHRLPDFKSYGMRNSDLPERPNDLPYVSPAASSYASYTVSKAGVGNIESFTMTISWLSANEASCEIMQAGSFADLTNSATKILNPMRDTDGDGGLIERFTDTLNCNNVPTIINDIRTEVPGGVTLPQYSTLELFTGDGDDKKVYAIFGFASNGTLTPNIGELPFTFGGEGPLQINAGLAQKTNLLVVIDYTTIEGNSCN